MQNCQECSSHLPAYRAGIRPFVVIRLCKQPPLGMAAVTVRSNMQRRCAILHPGIRIRSCREQDSRGLGITFFRGGVEGCAPSYRTAIYKVGALNQLTQFTMLSPSNALDQ